MTESEHDISELTCQDIIRARAWNSLHNSAGLAPVLTGSSFPLLKFWADCDGFSDSREPWTLTVFEVLLESTTISVLREATWRMSKDYDSIKQLIHLPMATLAFQPTVQVRDVELDRREVDERLRSGEGLTVPVMSIDDIVKVTTHVSSVGFEFFSQDRPSATLRLAWHDGTPVAWNPTIAWLGDLLTFLRQKL